MKCSLNGHRHGHQKTPKPKGNGSGQKRSLATRYWPRNITQIKAVRHNRWMRCCARLPRMIRKTSWELLTGRAMGVRAMLGRLPAATWCLSFLLVTAASLHALAQDERPVPPLPIDARQATARDHARSLSELADTAARDSARCQAYKKCRALLEDKMSIENDVPPDRSYTSTRGR
jgi:hypothetical protein